MKKINLNLMKKINLNLKTLMLKVIVIIVNFIGDRLCVFTIREKSKSERKKFHSVSINR
jgi:hypothetical protein